MKAISMGPAKAAQPPADGERSANFSLLRLSALRRMRVVEAPVPLLELAGVSKRFDPPAGTGSLVILEEISLEVRAGESVAVVGPSGSGKSTLLHLIGGLDRPSAGKVLLEGRDLGQLSEVQLAFVRNRLLGFVFQFHYLLPQCTVLENVLVPTLAGVGAESPGPNNPTRCEESPEERAIRLLKRLGLGERLDHRPGELSGGERQRVAVARALINQPRLLLADEPTGALDQASARELGRLLAELNREERVTLIVVTHSMELAAGMGRVFTLSGGRLQPSPAAPGTPPPTS
jgi:lipoprotein-releasing system ATP-binding protein